MHEHETPIKSYERWQDLYLAIRVDLRTARGDLARLRRRLTQSTTISGKSSKDRERALDLLIGESPFVVDLEIKIEHLENEEDEAKTAIEKINFGQRQWEWMVRDKMADAIIGFNRLHNPALQALGSILVDTLADGGRFGSESEHLEEHLVG